jgi:hypothetical protein
MPSAADALIPGRRLLHSKGFEAGLTDGQKSPYPVYGWGHGQQHEETNYRYVDTEYNKVGTLLPPATLTLMARMPLPLARCCYGKALATGCLSQPTNGSELRYRSRWLLARASCASPT